MKTTPAHEEFAAEITGVDLSRTLTTLEFETIERAINQFSVLIFPEQSLDDEKHIAFTRLFGELEEEHVSYYSRGVITYVGHIGNVDASGNRLPAGNQRVRSQPANNMWHSDSSFREVPSLFSLLFAYEIPEEGGDTEFVSARAAYARLEAELQATIDPLVGVHDYIFSRTKVGDDAVSEGQRTYMRPVRQRLVRRNPVIGAKNYYVGSHVRSIEGWQDADAQPLVKHLIDEAARPESVYRHRWRRGDLVMWDNRCVLHRGCGYDSDRYRRRLHQTRVRCPGPTLAEPL